MTKQYYVYILASQCNGTLHIGFTSNIEDRIRGHKARIIKGFTKKYDVIMLVYFEEFDSSFEAYQRKKQLKKWNRKWKLELIEKDNPNWNDIAENWE